MIFDRFWRASPEKEQKRRELRLEKIKAGKLKRNGLCALCLGGGGARGFAHVGAIKAFEEALEAAKLEAASAESEEPAPVL